MALHPFLQAEAGKHLSAKQLQDPAIRSLLNSLNEQYHRDADATWPAAISGEVCDALGAGLLLEDEKGQMIKSNAIFKSLFNLAGAPEQKNSGGFLVGQAPLFSDPLKFKSLCGELVSLERESAVHELELCNGTVLHLRYLPLSDDKGHSGRLWIFKDISEQKKAERNLHYLTNVQHNILNSTSFSIIYTNIRGIIVSFNKVSEQLLGYAAGEVTGRREGDFFYDAAAIAERALQLEAELGQPIEPGFTALVANARHGVVETREWPWITANGNTITMLVSVSAVKDAAGEVQGFLMISRDISAQKNAENALRLSEARYRNMIERSTEIIYTTNKEGYFTFVNPVTEQITGYTADELLKMHYLELIREDQREQVQEFYKKQVASGTASTYNEFPIRNKNGEEIWIGQSLQLSTNPDGEREIVALAINVTREKKAEISMIKTNQQLELFRDLIHSSSDAMQVVREDGRLFYLNNEACSRLGINETEVKNFQVSDINPEFSDHANWKKYVNNLKKKFAITYEGFNINQRSGKQFPVEVTVRYINIDGKGYIIANSRDITDRKKTEAVLKTQEEKYRNIIANMNLGLLEVDLDENIQYANQSFCQMSGYSQTELIGRKAMDLFADGQQKQLLKEKTRQRRRELSDMYELQVKNRKGEEKWWIVSGAPNYNDEGKLTGSIGIHLDITEQKKLSQDLKNAISKAEEASKAKEAFLANMSHEIRTPLNGIIGMIRELSHEQLTPRQKKYVKNASMGSQHLLSVLNNVLDISKIEAGELTLEKYPFNLGSTLKEVKQIMNSSAREKGLFLGLSTHEIKKFTYLGDAFRIRQALLNLVGNAIKFTQTGGVFIECRIVATSSDTHSIEITVEDTGIGMDKEFQSDLFKKFSQEDSSISRKHGGTGLGMAITHELIQLMGGAIEVKSVKNQGTVMKVCLDLLLSKDAVQGSETRSSLTDLGGARILLVEDNEFNRAVASRTLKRHHCSITEAANGQEAIGILTGGAQFDIILMDLQMPVMGGIEATRIIRQQLRNHTPVIALTANAFKSEIANCREAGMNDHVTKPFEEDVLVGLVARYKGMRAPLPDAAPLKTEAPAPEKKLYSLETLKGIGQGDQAFVNQMLRLFIKQSEEILKDMKKALEQRDHAQVSALAHKIKPGIDNMGITSLKQTIRHLENESRKGGDAERIKQLFSEVDQVLNEVIKALLKEEGME